MLNRQRVAVGVLAAAAMVVGTQSPASANSQWIVTDEAIAAVDAGALHDGWYQVYVENRILACSYVQVAYDGAPMAWNTVFKYGTSEPLRDCDAGGESTLLNTATSAVFFRTRTDMPVTPDIYSAPKAVYDDQ